MLATVTGNFGEVMKVLTTPAVTLAMLFQSGHRELEFWEAYESSLALRSSWEECAGLPGNLDAGRFSHLPLPECALQVLKRMVSLLMT